MPTIQVNPAAIARNLNRASIQLLDEKDAAAVDLYLPRSTLEFSERFNRFPVATPWFHKEWFRILDDDLIKKRLLLAPRGHAKTTVVLTWALRRLIENSRTKRIGIISGTDTLAESFMRLIIHELETNEELQKTYGRIFKPKNPQKWTSHEIILAGADLGKDVSLFATSTGAQITGRRADDLIFDDIETLDTVSTPERRTATREWFTREAMPVLVPGGTVTVIGTKKHEDDIYSYLEREGSGYTIIDNARRAILEDGMPLWPEYWSVEALEERKRELDAIDIRSWYHEYLNEPMPASTQMFKPLEWGTFRYHELPDNLTIVQAWDLAISQKQTADFTVCATLGIDQQQNIYILDIKRGRWQFSEQQVMFHNEFMSCGERFGIIPIVVGIEAVNYQAAAVQEAIRRYMMPIKALERNMRQSGRGAGRPERTPRDKVTRARLAEARGQLGKVLRPEPAPPWWADFASELAYFPAGAHDDQVDAFADAVQLAMQQVMDWGSIYKLHTCACGNRYVLQTPDRACPKCNRRP